MAESKTLFEQGYSVRLVWTTGRQRVVVGLFDVRKPDGTVYRVNMNNLVCSCEARKTCKHILQMQGLLMDCAAYWAARQKTKRDSREGQRCEDLSSNLLTAVNRLWGNGQMEFTGQIYHAAELQAEGLAA